MNEEFVIKDHATLTTTNRKEWWTLRVSCLKKLFCCIILASSSPVRQEPCETGALWDRSPVRQEPCKELSCVKREDPSAQSSEKHY